MIISGKLHKHLEKQPRLRFMNRLRIVMRGGGISHTYHALAAFRNYDHAARCMASKERSFTVSGDTQFSSSYRFRNEHSGTARSILLVLE